MPSVQLNSGMQSGWVEGVVGRKQPDGSFLYEDLGVIAYNHKNPFKVAKWEKETLGKVTEETAIRCAKTAAPYVAGGVAVCVGAAYLLLRR